MSGAAVAYDMFGTDYTDAEHDVRSDRSPSRGGLEGEDSTAGYDVNHPIHVLPVREIRTDEHKLILRKVIPVHLEGNHSRYLAIYESLRIYGEGDNPSGALRDFGNSLISVYLSYKHCVDPLSDGAKDYLEKLDQLIAKIEKI